MAGTAPLDRLGLSQTHKDLFALSMEVLDSNYRPPLLYDPVRISLSPMAADVAAQLVVRKALIVVLGWPARAWRAW
jgi:hypothetical protein